MPLMKQPLSCPISYLLLQVLPHPHVRSVVLPLAPGSTAFLSKGQPYDMALAMDRARLFVRTYNGFT